VRNGKGKRAHKGEQEGGGVYISPVVLPEGATKERGGLRLVASKKKETMSIF